MITLEKWLAYKWGREPTLAEVEKEKARIRFEKNWHRGYVSQEEKEKLKVDETILEKLDRIEEKLQQIQSIPIIFRVVRIESPYPLKKKEDYYY